MSRPVRNILLTACAVGLHPFVSHAQDAALAPPVENLLVTATRLPTDADDISAGVSVIDRATMRERGYVTLADALSAVAGVRIVATGQGNASLFVRGANSNQVQVLIDGVPVNDASGPGEAYNFGVETLSDVARIEVVRGPMSAVYGSGAIGGVVNIITDRAAAAPRVEATLAAGLPDALLAQAGVSGRAGALDYSLSAESRSDAGYDATPQRETVRTGERDGLRTQTGSAELGYTPVAGTRLFATVRGRSTVYGYDDVGYPAFDDPNETARDNDFLARAGVASSLLGGAWQTVASVAYDQEYRRYVNLLDAADPNQAAEDSRYAGLRTDLQWNNTIRLPDTGWSRAAALTGGYTHIDATARERLDSLSGGFPYLAAVDASDRRDAGYAGLQATLLGRTVVTGNLREEAVSGVGDAFTWRLGQSTSLPFAGSHLKASYGTAFLAPSLFDRYGIDSYGYVGNPLLKPERSRGYEIGWSADFGHPALGSLDVTFFHTHVDDLIETEFAPVYTSVNVQAARLQGVETSLHLHPAAWMDADLTYTYTDARNAGTGTQLLRRPYDSGAATLVLRPVPTLSIVPQVTFAGGELDALVDDQGYPAGTGRHGGGATLNLNITWRVRPRTSLFVWARNIADARYEAASGFAQPGPAFLAGVRLGD